MKLTGEKVGRRRLAAKELLEVNTTQEPLAFVPERDITPEQKERMLSFVNPHDQHLMAMGLTTYLFPDEPRVRQETEGFHFRAEVMKGTQISQQTGSEILHRLRGHMVGEASASLYPLSLINELPADFKHTLAKKIWEEALRIKQLLSKERPNSSDIFYGLMILLGAEKLLPEKKQEIQTYREWLKSGISVQETLHKLRFGQEPDSANWELLKLALIALAFPELHTEIRFDKDFWQNVRQEIQMYTDHYESLFATEAAFAATILAKIPQHKMSDANPLPDRLVA